MCVGVVGCCRCCPGGVLTAEGGPRHSWRRFPCASLAGGLALAPSVSLLPMASYRMVSPWWLSWMLRVAVGEVALPVVPSVMPVVKSLRALPWFTASLMLLMLLVVAVGLCVGCQWLLLLLVVVLGAGRWVARLERLGCYLAVGSFLVLVSCWRGCLRRRAGCQGCWCCRRRPRWFRVFSAGEGVVVFGLGVGGGAGVGVAVPGPGSGRGRLGVAECGRSPLLAEGSVAFVRQPCWRPW